MGTGRLETFADGVFAIAITLLVLEIPHPEVDEHLGRELVDQWPAYLAYVLSFVTIGIIWVNHHALMVQFARADRAFLFINVFFLMCVAFIPFPTALIADDLGSDVRLEPLLEERRVETAVVGGRPEVALRVEAGR